jgi:hypothetical protein
MRLDAVLLWEKNIVSWMISRTDKFKRTMEREFGLKLNSSTLVEWENIVDPADVLEETYVVICHTAERVFFLRLTTRSNAAETSWEFSERVHCRHPIHTPRQQSLHGNSPVRHPPIARTGNRSWVGKLGHRLSSYIRCFVLYFIRPKL